MFWAVLFPSIFAIFAWYKKKLTFFAIILAWILGVIIFLTGGLYAFLALALTFICTILSDKLKIKNDDKKRDIYQIISNVLTPALCLILYYVKSSEIFFIMYFSVIGASLADTLASSIGSLSTKWPRNPLTFKKMRKGESGAVSYLGLNASILGGLIIGGVYYLAEGISGYYLFIIMMGLLGSYIDSILGAFIQGKFECKKCHKKCEVLIHCDVEAKLIRGIKFIDNNLVNLLTNIIIFCVSYLFLR